MKFAVFVGNMKQSLIKYDEIMIYKITYNYREFAI